MIGDGSMVLVAAAAVLCGGVASVLRYLVSVLLGGRGTLQWAVLVVNVVGSALGGAVLGLAESGVISTDLRLILLGGVAGGLTTFSTWSVETVELALTGKWFRSALNVGLNIVLGSLVATAAWLLVQ
ncbi:camphor resistance protein CrcB [Glaciihabitans tibetensis]|uniref:Fluoride-specific ion channel FluC n=1 Tax=Glaciihabitans tibetensis TaxID=1266600 RepID=A0A2T0VDA6_9MICO|nr:CrcB family protein [Glaciihabitans tibetensis]PRY68157.1 camphor resistance protein CrcB [Glaciihabitans tibetensis]